MFSTWRICRFEVWKRVFGTGSNHLLIFNLGEALRSRLNTTNRSASTFPTRLRNRLSHEVVCYPSWLDLWSVRGVHGKFHCSSHHLRNEGLADRCLTNLTFGAFQLLRRGVQRLVTTINAKGIPEPGQCYSQCYCGSIIVRASSFGDICLFHRCIQSLAKSALSPFT